MPRTHERTNFLADIIIGAVEGGTGYWAQASGYITSLPEETRVTLWEFDERERPIKAHHVGIESVARAVNKIVRREAEINQDIRKAVKEGSRRNDASQLDANDCDAIVQIAIFGEIVYG